MCKQLYWLLSANGQLKHTSNLHFIKQHVQAVGLQHVTFMLKTPAFHKDVMDVIFIKGVP